MRVLGIDFGDRRIGLALSDPLRMTAQMLGQYERQTPEKDREYFMDLIRRHQISEIVIGLPLRMNGTEGSRVEKTKVFGDWLREAVNINIHYWDERLTTIQAMAILNEQNFKMKKKKRFKDQVSAALILSSYLESHRKNSNDFQNT